VVNNALGLVLVEHGTWMNADIHAEFGCFVDILAMVFSTVYEETANDAFADVGI
jgi:hypothetical protein